MSLGFSPRLVVAFFDWNLFLREQLNVSLHGAQSQDQSASDSPRSNHVSCLGLISDGHPWPTHFNYPMDIQSGQAPLLKHNQHLLDFYSLSGTEHWTPLRLSPILPTYSPNTRESCLHSYNSDANYNQLHKPRSLTATVLPPCIPDEHPLFHTTNTLRRTSFSTLNAKGSHDGHQHTGEEYPLSSSTPAKSSFSIGRSTVKYDDTNMYFDCEASSHHYLNQTSSYATLQKPPLDISDRSYGRLFYFPSFSAQFDQMYP